MNKRENLTSAILSDEDPEVEGTKKAYYLIIETLEMNDVLIKDAIGAIVNIISRTFAKEKEEDFQSVLTQMIRYRQFLQRKK